MFSMQNGQGQKPEGATERVDPPLLRTAEELHLGHLCQRQVSIHQALPKFWLCFQITLHE